MEKSPIKSFLSPLLSTTRVTVDKKILKIVWIFFFLSIRIDTYCTSSRGQFGECWGASAKRDEGPVLADRCEPNFSPRVARTKGVEGAESDTFRSIVQLQKKYLCNYIWDTMYKSIFDPT